VNSIKVTFADGNYLYTGINATLEEAKAYYIGHAFQFGDTEDCPRDKLVRATAVDLVQQTQEEIEQAAKQNFYVNQLVSLKICFGLDAMLNFVDSPSCSSVADLIKQRLAPASLAYLDDQLAGGIKPFSGRGATRQQDNAITPSGPYLISY
jgi:hypothetical protein